MNEQSFVIFFGLVDPRTSASDKYLPVQDTERQRRVFSGLGQAEQMRTVGIFHKQLLQKITPISSKSTFGKLEMRNVCPFFMTLFVLMLQNQIYFHTFLGGKFYSSQPTSKPFRWA